MFCFKSIMNSKEHCKLFVWYHQYFEKFEDKKTLERAQKIFFTFTHIMSAEPNSLSTGIQGPLKGPGRWTIITVFVTFLIDSPYGVQFG